MCVVFTTWQLIRVAIIQHQRKLPSIFNILKEKNDTELDL